MRQQGAVRSAAGLVPFGHLGWAYADRAEFYSAAASYIADGLEQDQWVEVVADAEPDALRAELVRECPALRPEVENGRIHVTPVSRFYVFQDPDPYLVDADASVAERVKATQKALDAGYTGSRAIVDATSVASSPRRRDAFVKFEYLIDQKMAELPASAMCAYDSSQLQEQVADLVCLHPLTGPSPTVSFRLYTEPDADLALAGEIDASNIDLFGRTLQRTWPMLTGDEIVIDARGLTFITHRALLGLEHYAGESGCRAVIRGAGPEPRRVARMLDLTHVTVA